MLASLQPLRDALAPLRSDTAKAVAAQRDVAGIAFLTALLRWPDRSQAQGYLQGFDVVGTIQTSGVFRPVSMEPLEEDFFGPAAELEERKP